MWWTYLKRFFYVDWIKVFVYTLMILVFFNIVTFF